MLTGRRCSMQESVCITSMLVVQLSLLLLLAGPAAAQQLSEEQQLALTTTPSFTLHNYTYNGQILYTACPCMASWKYTALNGSVLELSGCANPDNDSAGPFCQINDTSTQCPSGETLSMSNGGRKFRVVACLPQRARTIAGCLCSPYWSERDDITLSLSWPIMARDRMQKGLHEGWLMAGNCSKALNLPGGARCTVTEGTCSSMPNKAYPPPSPNIFWQVTSPDAQAWDFCADPLYDAARAQQPGTAAEVLAALPVNVRAGVKTTTQAVCSCSPLNWTHYPAVIRDVNQPLSSFLGCANPDADPLGPWCPVDPVACPSHYGAKQSQPGDVPANMMYRYYFDYCGPVRNKTEAGCLCMGNWKPTFNSSLESRPNPSGAGILPDPNRTTTFSGGVCGTTPGANPPGLDGQRSWCYVDYRTCLSQPAGAADGTAELHWDYCPVGIPAAAAPAAADPTAAAAAALPAAAAGGAAGPPTPGLYLPASPAQQAQASPAGSPGLYLPTVSNVTTQESAAAPVAATPGTPQVPTPPGATPATTSVEAVPAAGPATVQDSSSGGGGGKPVPVVAIVVPVVVAAVLIAAAAGFLLHRRRRKQQLRKGALQWASTHVPGMPPPPPPPTRSATYNYDRDVESGTGNGSTAALRGPGVVGSELPGYQRLEGNGGAAAGAQGQHNSGKSAGQLPPHYKAGIGHYAASAASQQIQVGHVKAAGSGPEGQYSLTSSYRDTHLFDGSSATGSSQVPLMGYGGAFSSSSKDAYTAVQGAAAAAELQAGGVSSSGSSGLPQAAGGPAAALRRTNDLAAAAAVEAEQRAASLAALWESGSGHAMAGSLPSTAPAAAPAPTGARDLAGGAALPPRPQKPGQQDQQQQQGQQQQGAANNKPTPFFARIFSSPFANNGSKMLPQLWSTEPPGESIELQSVAGAGITGHKQQEQQAGSLPNRTHTPLAPPTPSKDRASRLIVSAPAADDAVSSTSGSKQSRFSWVYGGTAAPEGPAGRGGSSVCSSAGDTQLSGLTGMSTWKGTDAGGAGASKESPYAGIGLVPSIAPPATRHLSGPMMDPNWDFGKSSAKPVRVLLQVMDDPGVSKPVTLLLVVSAPPPKPDILAHIVLPKDPPLAGVDLSIDANRDLAFPSNSFLGQGAFGQVHRALYKGRHPVAVKMLTDPDLRGADADTLHGFREELQIMAKLDHPHVVKCYGGNLEGPNPFIVTELCECSMDKMIGHYKRKFGTGLPLKHTLTIGLHIASALWHLHPSVVHRDLKPQNVLLDISGTAKVTDFGLSRMKTHTFVTTQHVEAGTASYMAPECFGSAGVSEKVDVYALGMLLWECVVGERPWKGCNLVQVAFQVAMAGNRPPLPEADPCHCPAELVQLIGDCWAANPKERPSSGEVMKALAQMIRVYVPNQ